MPALAHPLTDVRCTAIKLDLPSLLQSRSVDSIFLFEAVFRHLEPHRRGGGRGALLIRALLRHAAGATPQVRQHATRGHGGGPAPAAQATGRGADRSWPP